jgi:hypothetical protein
LPTGRFLSIDPIWATYLGMSPYAYCGNSPNVLVDPSGFGGHRVVHHTENGDWTTMEPDEEPMPSEAGYGIKETGCRALVEGEARLPYRWYVSPVRDSGMG